MSASLIFQRHVLNAVCFLNLDLYICRIIWIVIISITLERARFENQTHENRNQYGKSDHVQRNRSYTSSPPLPANSKGNLRINQNPCT